MRIIKVLAGLALAPSAGCGGEASSAMGSGDSDTGGSDLADAGDPDMGGPDLGDPDVGEACAFTQADLQAELDAVCVEEGTLGAVLVVQCDRTTRIAASCGHADLARTRPLVLGDRFRVGSITKPFTGALVLGLVEEGAISLDDTIASFGIETDAADAITVRHLLGNTSGLVDFNAMPSFDWGRAWTTPEIIAWVTDTYEPSFAPGTEFLYSGTGYLILSEIVAAETGMPYVEALRERLLDPLGLDDTFLEDGEPIPGGFVEGSYRAAADLGPPLEDVLFPSADGTLVSTADDLLDWGSHLLLDRDVLSEASLEAMTTPTMLVGDATPSYPDFLRGGSYGLALAILDAPEGPIYWHGGLNWGFLASLEVQPATGRAVALLLNTENVTRTRFSDLGWALLRR